jgi:hypothetical protein
MMLPFVRKEKNEKKAQAFWILLLFAIKKAFFSVQTAPIKFYGFLL